MYTIKQAAELTGIPPATLRAWERRYDLLHPARSSGGYRLYDEETVRDAMLMAELVRLGQSPKLAAAKVAERGRARRGLRGSYEDGAEPAVLAISPAVPDTSEFLAAARAEDPRALSRAAETAFAGAPLEEVIGSWLLPVLADIGEGWLAGTVTIAAEHLAAHALMWVLSERLDAALIGLAGPEALVGLPSGSRHELGALAFAALAAERLQPVRYLGADLPHRDWAAAAQNHDVVAAVVAVPMRSDVRAASATCAELAKIDGLVVAAGGGGQDYLQPPTIPLGHDLGAAVDHLRSLVHEARPPLAG